MSGKETLSVYLSKLNCLAKQGGNLNGNHFFK